MGFLINTINIETLKEMGIEILIAIVSGLIINLIYKKAYNGIAISNNFANTLTGLTIISYFIIKCITSNVVLSLGMVGALSIVRFRNSVKDSSDIMFAFWAIAQGIVIGAQQYLLSILFLLVTAIVILIMNINTKKLAQKRLLIVRYQNSLDMKQFEKCLHSKYKKFNIKEQNINGDFSEMIIEVKSQNNLNELQDLKIKGVISISIANYTGPVI